MKSKKSIAFVATVIAAAGQCALGGLRKDFRAPKGEARGNIGPFLWMHGTESERRLREYVGVLDAGGQNTVTIESRPHDGWMLDTWWRDVDVVLDECRKRGMKMMIYDDYWFPSQGFGAMFPIPREFQCRDVKADVYDRAKAPAKVENEIARAAANEVAKGVLDLRPDGGKIVIYRWTVADPAHVEGLPRGRGFPLVNGLDAAAVDWFLDRFYKPYYDRYRSAFEDGTIIGYFFDEPYTKGWWGPEMEKAFAARGEDAAELLTALRFRHADPERQARARYRFHDIRAEVWGRTMFGRHSDWCEKRGVFSSGHFFEHDHTHYDFTFSGGNVMQLLKYVAVPGIDLVCRQVYPDLRSRRKVEIGCGQMPKYASSLAHVYNRRSSLNWCETFGGYGQGLKYPHMKWLADWMHYQGCHFFVPHSFNMAAPLDSDYPPYFYNGGYEPRFPLYRVWADYSNRCAMMLSGTGHVCRIAQCMPGQSIHVGRTVRPEMFAFAVQDAQLDSDFMDYAAVESSRIERNPRTGRPSLRSERGVEHYDILVLPATEYVPFATLEKALAFAKAGGVVVGYAVKPSNTPSLGRTAADAKRIVAEIFAHRTALFLEKEPDGPALRAALAAKYPGEERPLAVREFDFEGLRPEDGRMLAVKLNERPDATALFIANQDEKRRRELKVRTKWPVEKVELWNPMQGTMERPEVADDLVKLSLEPAESVFLVWPKGEAKETTKRVLPAASSHRRFLPVSISETVVPVAVEEGVEYKRLMAFVRPLEGAKWIWHPVDPMREGCVTFRRTLDLPATEEATLTFACASAATVYVNGAEIATQTSGAEPFFRGWSAPVKTNVSFRAGRNEIRVEARNRWCTENRKPRKAGFVAAIERSDGEIVRTGEDWEVCRSGEVFVKARRICDFGDKPWRKCLLGPTRSPYKESIATECRFSLSELGPDTRVYFECDGTEGENSAALTLNGEYAGGFIGRPFRSDITHLARKGENILVAKPFRVKNPHITMQNTRKGY